MIQRAIESQNKLEKRKAKSATKNRKAQKAKGKRQKAKTKQTKAKITSWQVPDQHKLDEQPR